MPFLGIFGKKDRDSAHHLSSSRSRSNLSLPAHPSSSSTIDDDDYVIPPVPSIATAYYDHRNPSPNSSYPRRSLPPPERSTLRLVTSPSSPSSLPPELQLPTIKHSPLDELRSSDVFFNANQPSTSATSLHSQATSAQTIQSNPSSKPGLASNNSSLASRQASQAQAQAKRSSLFGWISGGAKKKPSSDVLSVKSSKSSTAEATSSRRTPNRRGSSSEDIPPVPSVPTRNSSYMLPSSPTSTKPNNNNTGFQVTSRPKLGPAKDSASSSAASSTVTAGAFRQAARRSATNLTLPVPNNLSNTSLPASLSEIPPARSPARTATPPSSFRDSRILQAGSETPPNPSRLSREDMTPPRRSTEPLFETRHSRQPAGSPAHNLKAQKRPTSRLLSSDSESDSDDRLERQSTMTITRRSAVRQPHQQQQLTRQPRSESGHHSRPLQRPRSYARTESDHSTPPASVYGKAVNPTPIYGRPRGSQSTSALSANKPNTRPESTSDSSEEESSDRSSSDDAPLSALMTKRRVDGADQVKRPPARPQRLQPAKPLIDLNAKSTFTSVDGRARGGAPLRRDPSIRSVRSEEDVRGVQARGTSVPPPRNEAVGRPSALKRPSNMSGRSSSEIITPTKDVAPGPLRAVRNAEVFSPPHLHRNSPASSSNGGDSSSGFLPLTPRDGSDLSDTRLDGGLSERRRPVVHQKRASVTFAVSNDKVQLEEIQSDEQRRRERRRSEARNAIELGNVVNGPGPVVSHEDDESLLPSRYSMASYSQPNNIWGFWGASPGNTHVGQMPGYISASSSAIDSTFLAAHQHAMAIAKQTYQMAVAQQAMAAAADEWERGSAVSGMGGGGGMMGWGGMYSSGSRSMYAGSVGGPSNWGTASLYGDSIGSMSAHSLPTSAMLPQQVVFPPSFYSSSASEGPQDSVRPRQRTRTAPSSQGIPVLPAQNSAPPSSWKKPRS